MGNQTETKKESSRMVTGMFRDRESAEKAYQSATSRGYETNDVNLLMSDDTRKTHFSDDEKNTDLGNQALKGAGVGAGIGGTVGGILAAIAAVGTLAIPGVGIVAAGSIAAALAGMGAGGAAGGLIGALVGAGIPEERAKVYESGIKDGGIVMGVKPRSDEDADYLEREWKNNKGEQVYR